MSNKDGTIPESLDESSHRNAAGGPVWPIHRTSLATLIDLGLTDGQIAAYFSVNLMDVKFLCRHYVEVLIRIDVNQA